MSLDFENVSHPSRRSLSRAATVTITCQILPYEIASGPANMALDEALLDRVSAEPDAAFLRIYGWTVPTLSLGYFQHLAQAAAEPRWQSVPLVRRPTGGGAIWHHHELTYALVLPGRPSPGAAEHRPLPSVHAAIAAAIRDPGLEVRSRRSGRASRV